MKLARFIWSNSLPKFPMFILIPPAQEHWIFMSQELDHIPKKPFFYQTTLDCWYNLPSNIKWILDKCNYKSVIKHLGRCMMTQESVVYMLSICYMKLVPFCFCFLLLFLFLFLFCFVLFFVWFFFFVLVMSCPPSQALFCFSCRTLLEISLHMQLDLGHPKISVNVLFEYTIA